MIYLDNASTTKVDARVFEDMVPYLTYYYGNPGNIHILGKQSKNAIEVARAQVAAMIGAKPENIIFTSGGSEANTTVFRGLSDLFLDKDLYTVATSNAEHKSVIRAAETIYRRIELPVERDGSVSVESVKRAYESDDSLALVSVMHTNNETGSVSDVKSIASFCKEHGILFHTDCVQAAGFHKLDVEDIGCDFMSISSHKIHGPKGVGALYVRNPELLQPVIFGGTGQEYGLRGGTENVAGIVGFGRACQIVQENIDRDHAHMVEMSNLMKDIMLRYRNMHEEEIVTLNGQQDVDRRILNFCFHGYDGETLLMTLNCMGVAVSAGAACNSKESVASYVLKSMGVSDEDAMSSIRISVSRDTTEDDIRTAAASITRCLNANFE